MEISNNNNNNAITNNIIKLDVGGELITTRKSTLQNLKDSMISAMFDDKFAHSLDKSPNYEGAYFIDANPKIFKVILDLIRNIRNHEFLQDEKKRESLKPKNVSKEVWMNELDYWIGPIFCNDDDTNNDIAYKPKIQNDIKWRVLSYDIDTEICIFIENKEAIHDISCSDLTDILLCVFFTFFKKSIAYSILVKQGRVNISFPIDECYTSKLFFNVSFKKESHDINIGLWIDGNRKIITDLFKSEFPTRAIGITGHDNRYENTIDTHIYHWPMIKTEEQYCANFSMAARIPSNPANAHRKSQWITISIYQDTAID
jgi:hypothetical protein